MTNKSPAYHWLLRSTGAVSQIALMLKAMRLPRCRYVDDGRLPPESSESELDRPLVEGIVASLVAAKQDQVAIRGPYAPALDWNESLNRRWAEPLRMMKAGNVGGVEIFFRRFFRNDALAGFWAEGRVFDDFVKDRWWRKRFRALAMDRQIATWRDTFPDTPFSELAAPNIGSPWGYDVAGHTVYEPACEYHLQAAHFATLLEVRKSASVLEIGGGFGGLAYFLLKRSAGVRYVGLDLPENIALQTYYLAKAFPGIKILCYSQAKTLSSPISWRDHDVVLLPNFMLPAVASESIDLVINIRSFAEMPAETIAEYYAQIDRVGKLFFFHENLCKARSGPLHGIPCGEFPRLNNFIEVFNAHSRWPRYSDGSGYPCRERLFLHRRVCGGYSQ